jgi:hypothetical protein
MGNHTANLEILFRQPLNPRGNMVTNVAILPIPEKKLQYQLHNRKALSSLPQNPPQSSLTA